MGLAGEANEVVKFVIAVMFGFGIALFLGNTLQTALGVNAAGNAVGSLITGVTNNITTVVAVVSIVVVLLIYGVAKNKGLI